MNYESSLLEYVAKLAQVDKDACAMLAVEAYEHTVVHERYRDAALIIILACRRLETYESRSDLLGRFAALDSWETLLRVKFFTAWLVESQLGKAAQPRIRYNDSEPRAIETENNSEEELLSTCRIVFSDLESELRQYQGRNFGGMNLLFFLNRSRRSFGSPRVHNPASFGLRYISPESDEERDSILGRVEQSQIRIRSVHLGTEGPQDREV
jgi:hypothetical protein